jgi:hypothetical protein
MSDESVFALFAERPRFHLHDGQGIYLIFLLTSLCLRPAV